MAFHSPEPSFHKSILFSYFSAFFFWGAVYIYMPILPSYTKVVSGSLQSVGAVMGAYGLSQLILRIPLGLVSDRSRRRKPFVLLGFIFDALAALGLLLSTSTVMLFFSVLTAGIAASIWVPYVVLFSSYFPLGLIAHSMSMIMFFTRIAQILTNYGSGIIAEAWGWVAPFYVAIVFSLVGLVFAIGMAENRPPKTSIASPKQLLLVGKNPLLLISAFSCTLIQFTNFATVFGFTPIFSQQIGATKGQLGILVFYYMLTNTVATVSSGTLLPRFLSQRSMIVIGFVVTSAAIFLIPWADSLNILYALQAVQGAGGGLVFPVLMALAIESIPREQQATAMGFFQSLYAVGMSLGPILSGMIAQPWGLSSVFIVNGLLCVFGAFFSFIKIPSPHEANIEK